MIEILKKFTKEKVITSFFDAKKSIVASTLLEEALIIASLFKQEQKKILVVKNNLYNAQLLYDYLLCFLKQEDVKCFFFDETLRIEAIASSKEMLAQRLDTLSISLGNKPLIVLTHTLGYLKYIPTKENFLKCQKDIKVNQSINKEDLVKLLLVSGYKRVNRVSGSLEFSVRGAIIDFFAVNYDNPIRIEFFSTLIESIRFFDINTQRTLSLINEAVILPASEFIVFNGKDFETLINTELTKHKDFLAPSIFEELTENTKQDIDSIKNHDYKPSLYKYYPFFEDVNTISQYFNPDICLLMDKKAILENYDLMIKENYEYQEELFLLGKNLKNLEMFDSFEKVNMKNKYNVVLKPFAEKESDLSLNIKSLPSSGGNSNLSAKIIQSYLYENYQIYLYLNNDNQIASFNNLCDEYKLNKETLIIKKENLIEGFEIPHKKEVYLTARELYGSNIRISKYFSRYKSATMISSYGDLEKGDYLVHDNYGIGIYRGLKTIKTGDSIKDYLHLEYKGGETLYVPLEQFSLVRKYSGREGKVPTLNKLGSNDWDNTKKRIKGKVKDIAIDLINLYEERTKRTGYAFSRDDEMQYMFEEAFVYEPTVDQVEAIKIIKEEMEKKVPMDVLLCGDVGFGKTEVAFVAAFKAIKEGKQVAFLCPTTLLSAQHFENAVERFQNFGVKIELLNRFKTPKEQAYILKHLKEGKIDFLIGTHRILSDDVQFKDLGVLIVDEEQRFGVQHKEKITNLKRDIDVLTLSATPIPRTMQMSLIGIRTLVQLQTPPSERLPVQTYVIEKDFKVIKEIIERELSRKGQVFYLYNNTSDIHSVAFKIQQEIKNAKVGVIHGKMDKELIEEVSQSFYNNKVNVLVCTTIIENGIDVSNANTMIIENADKFGLSQLYQIRGRVGRGSKLAYAYLLINKQKRVTELASNRLRTIKDFSELGSGYKIALKDLSIRGAGDILGAQQAGFIENIGFDLYLDLLKEAIEEEKGNITKVTKEETKIIQTKGYIPISYAQIDSNKIDLYKKLQQATTFEKLESLKEETKDLYGRIPANVKLLLEKKQAEILLNKNNIAQVKEQTDYFDINFSKEFSSRDGIGVTLFELINEIDFKNISLNFQKESIRVRIKKKNVNWTNYINRILQEFNK